MMCVLIVCKGLAVASYKFASYAYNYEDRNVCNK